MKVRVLYFAAARERVGQAAEALELEGEGLSVARLKEAVLARHASLAPIMRHLRVAVDQSFVSDDAAVPDGAEVAFIPPVAGGAASAGGRFRVLETPLSVDAVLQQVSAGTTGGIATFIGRVRNQTKQKTVVRLDYEAYVPMAERVLAGVADEAAQKWPGTVVAIHHRVGSLVPGDTAVVIAAAAPHRKEAFRACEYALERLKEDAPIWKKEWFEDGAVWVGLGP